MMGARNIMPGIVDIARRYRPRGRIHTPDTPKSNYVHLDHSYDTSTRATIGCRLKAESHIRNRPWLDSVGLTSIVYNLTVNGGKGARTLTSRLSFHSGRCLTNTLAMRH